MTNFLPPSILQASGYEYFPLNKKRKKMLEFFVKVCWKGHFFISSQVNVQKYFNEVKISTYPQES